MFVWGTLASRRRSPMIDANEWLDRHRPGRFVGDRTRGDPLAEKIEAGDVLDDGSLMTQNGLIVVGGCHVWLTERKAAAALYYGWRRCLNMGLGRDSNTGEILYSMTR